jgi:hypothetical protein
VARSLRSRVRIGRRSSRFVVFLAFLRLSTHEAHEFPALSSTEPPRRCPEFRVQDVEHPG